MRCRALQHRGATLLRAGPTTPTKRWASSLSQRPKSDYVSFPGALKSAFKSKLEFQSPRAWATLPTYRVVDQDGNVVDSTFEADLDEAGVVKLYTDMVYISVLDLIMFEAQRQGRVSFYMVSAGEEAISVGTSSVLDRDDVIFSQYREQGAFRERGFTTRQFMAQLFATSEDPGRARSMPVHYGSGELNIHTISSTLGTQLPHAAGCAYAQRLRRLQDPTGKANVTVAFFGEGTSSGADFHGALNIAATRSCPVVYVCRNNGFAISTPTLDQYRGDGVASRGTGYGIETIRVDGNDVWAVREAVKRAREIALGGGPGGTGETQPVLIEAMSYRVSHHSTSDDSFAYRARVEVDDWKRRDNPITRLRKYMEARGMWDDARDREVRDGFRREILAGIAEAEKAKRPPLRAMFDDTYAELTPQLREQMGQLRGLMERYPDEYDVGAYEGGMGGLDE